jgi:hypothetical protein
MHQHTNEQIKGTRTDWDPYPQNLTQTFRNHFIKSTSSALMPIHAPPPHPVHFPCYICVLIFSWHIPGRNIYKNEPEMSDITPPITVIHSMHFVNWAHTRLNFATPLLLNSWIEPHNLDIKNEKVTRTSRVMCGNSKRHRS